MSITVADLRTDHQGSGDTRVGRWHAALRMLLLVLLCGTLTPPAAAACRPGVYGPDQDAFVVIGAPGPVPGSAPRYLFRDGRRGTTTAPSSPVSCDADVASVVSPGGDPRHGSRQATHETDTRFVSAGTTLVGRLIEPAGEPDGTRPLVVLVGRLGCCPGRHAGARRLRGHRVRAGGVADRGRPAATAGRSPAEGGSTAAPWP